MLSWYEELKRGYSNGVTITYEIINNEDIYIYTQLSLFNQRSELNEIK